MTGSKQHKQLCYTIKQQLSREISIEKVRTAEKFKNKNEDTTSKPASKINLFNQKPNNAQQKQQQQQALPASPTIKVASSLMELMSHREFKPNAKKQMFKVKNLKFFP